MQNADKFYINGEWVTPSTSGTCDVINPATAPPIAQIAMGGTEDVDRAVAAAREAFKTVSRTPVEERSERLGRIIDASKARLMGAYRLESRIGLPSVKPLGCVLHEGALRVSGPGSRETRPATVGTPLSSSYTSRGVQHRVTLRWCKPRLAGRLRWRCERATSSLP